MDCREFLDRYSEYDDSLLSTRELERFTSHMAGCGSCARYDRVLRKGRMLARQLPPVRPGEDFIPRLHHRLRYLQERRNRRAAAVPMLGGAAAAFAAVTVVLTSFWAVSLMDQASEPVVIRSMAPEQTVQEANWSQVASGGVVWRGAAAGHGEASASGAWAARRVDHRVPATYSPLVTGPPAFRAAGAFPHSASASTLRTLD